EERQHRVEAEALPHLGGGQDVETARVFVARGVGGDGRRDTAHGRRRQATRSGRPIRRTPSPGSAPPREPCGECPSRSARSTETRPRTGREEERLPARASRGRRPRIGWCRSGGRGRSVALAPGGGEGGTGRRHG